MKKIIYLLLAMATALPLYSQDSLKAGAAKVEASLQHRLDAIEKKVDDLLWFERAGDIAFIDKVYITGPPKANVPNPKLMGAANPLKFWCYVFLPKNIDQSKDYPLLILPHGGVHANFDTYYTHIIRELVYQGYVVAAPEFRGSTGYGEAFYKTIDYGGLEVEDCDGAREYMIENYDFVDGSRVGMIGWSHGGLIALMAAFNHPDEYKAVFAGVPVSDLVMRMGYYDDEYRGEFSAAWHIGKTPQQDLEEYKKRSPVWNVSKLKTPLLIHTNTNDDDVYYIEVEHLIQALKAEGKDFDYEVFKDAPGGHSFDRIDIKNARQIRLKIYKFLAAHLGPPRPAKTPEDLTKAAYTPGG